MEKTKYSFKDIVWKDFFLIAILIVSMIVFTVIGILFSFVFVDHLTEKIVIKISVVVQLLS